MAISNLPSYKVRVKDYHWTDKKVRVQSPVLNLEKTESPPVFRPKEGNNRDEPRVASTAEKLSDDVGESEYFAEAHGVFVPGETGAQHIPLWVTYQQVCSEAKGIIPFVDLRSSTCSRGPIARICWVPTHKSRDGKLYTILGGTRVFRRERKKTSRTDACVQYEDAPEGARITSLSPNELSCLDPVCPEEKQRKFLKHLRLITRNWGAAPSGMASALATARSRYHFGNQWPSPNRMLDLSAHQRPAECSLSSTPKCYIPKCILNYTKSSLPSAKPRLFAIPECRIDPAERRLYSANRHYRCSNSANLDRSYDEAGSEQEGASPTARWPQHGVSRCISSSIAVGWLLNRE